MRPRERRETGEQDLFRSRLDQIIDMNHALVKLARTIDWGFLEERVRRGLHRRAGPAATADAVDGGACDPQAHLRPLRRSAVRALGREPLLPVSSAARSSSSTGLVFDRSSLTRWRNRMGEERLQALAAGEPGGRHQDRRDQAVRALTASSSTPRCSPRTSPSRPTPSC